MADQSQYLMNKKSQFGEILHGGPLYSVDFPKNWGLPENSKVKEVFRVNVAKNPHQSTLFSPNLIPVSFSFFYAFLKCSSDCELLCARLGRFLAGKGCGIC